MDLFDDTIIVVNENKRRFDAIFDKSETKEEDVPVEAEETRRLQQLNAALIKQTETLRREIMERDDHHKHSLDEYKAENSVLKKKIQEMQMHMNQLKEGRTIDPDATRIVRFQLNNPSDERIRDRYHKNNHLCDESAESSGTDSSGITSVGSSGPECQNCTRLRNKCEAETQQFTEFQQLARHFRQAVFEILGYKVKMNEDMIVVQLVADPSLMASFTLKDGHYQLVNKDILSKFKEEARKYVDEMDSLPHFFAALTLRSPV